MGLNSAIDEKLMDNRLRDKFLAEGKITKAMLEEYLASLPDDSKNADFIKNSSIEKKRRGELGEY